MSNTDSPWLQNALSIVGQYQPETLTQMRNKGWKVNVCSTDQDFNELAAQTHWSVASDLANNALGITINPNAPVPYYLRGASWLNRPRIHQQAYRIGADPNDVAAAVLVHEFMHNLGYGEKEAYEAQVLFAKRMGSQAIADTFTKVGRRALMEEAMETHGKCPVCGRNH